MPASHVYMILYARQASYVNKKMKDLRGRPPGAKKGNLVQLINKYGDA